MISRIGIGAVKRKRISVPQKMFQVRNRNGESQSFAEGQLHINHAHDLSSRIEQRTTAVSGVDLSRRLDIDDAFHVAIASTDNAF